LSKQKGWSERTHNTWGVKASPKSNQGKHWEDNLEQN
jgi:hypothetical protein